MGVACSRSPAFACSRVSWRLQLGVKVGKINGVASAGLGRASGALRGGGGALSGGGVLSGGGALSGAGGEFGRRGVKVMEELRRRFGDSSLGGAGGVVGRRVAALGEGRGFGM